MNENELVKLAVQGDRHAFGEIVKKYQGRIYNLGLKMTGNEQDAEDILQETFLSALKNINNFEMKSAIYTWLYRIGINFGLQKINQRKKDFNNVSINGPEAEVIHGEHSNEWPDFASIKINNKLFKDKLNSALIELPEKYRTVFILRDLHGLSTSDTARILNITESNTKIRLMRTRNFLKEKMENIVKHVELS